MRLTLRWLIMSKVPQRVGSPLEAQDKRETYQEGLQSLFPPCSEPVPANIERLLNRLREVQR